MKQSYNWQLLFFIKILKQEFLNHGTIQPFLLERLKEIQQMAEAKDVCVNICIETDLSPTSFFKDLPTDKINPDRPYFVLVSIKGSKDEISPIKDLHEVCWKDFSRSTYLIDVVSKGSLANPESITEVIEKFSNYYDTTYTMVTTFDHGSAYGIFYDPYKKSNILGFKDYDDINTISDKGYLKVFEPFPAKGVNVPKGFPKTNDKNRLVTGETISAFEEPITQKIKSLTMDELASGLSGLKKGKADILLMLNCYMMTIDTQYALKDNVDYLIASQALIPIEMFEMDHLINHILENLEILPKDLAKFIIGRIEMHKIFQKKPNYLDITSIVNIDLQTMVNEGVWEEFKNICSQLKNLAKINSHASTILYRREFYEIMPKLVSIIDSNIYTIDFVSILNSIGQAFPDKKEFSKNIKNFITLYNASSGLSDNKNKIIKSIAKDAKYHCKGVSCFFPNDKEGFDGNAYLYFYYNEYENNPNLALIAKETDWNEFLYLLYKSIPHL